MQFLLTLGRRKLPNCHEIHDKVHSISTYYGHSRIVFTLVIIAGACVTLIAYGIYCKQKN